MSNDYLPKKEQDLKEWLANFSSIVSTHVQELGLTTQQVTQIGENYSSVAAGLAAVTSAKNTAKSKVVAKEGVVKDAIASTREIVHQIQGNANVSPELKQLLKINTHETPRTNTPPVTPTDLQAKPFINGTNRLKWKAGDNKPNTRYVIEYRVGNTGAYSYLANTAATKYNHTGQTLGVLVWYRVRAERRNLVSDWTEGESVYGGKEESETTLRTAA